MSDSSKKMKMNRKKPLKFIDLNVDCLLGIFKYLSFDDFTELFPMHQRLYDPIALILRKKLVDINYRGNVRSIEDFLPVFGAHIKMLKIRGLEPEDTRKILESISQNCNGGNVIKFEINQTKLNDQFLRNSVNLFNNLKSLTLASVNINHKTFESILRMCKRLKELDLAESRDNYFVGGIDYLLNEIASSDIESICLRIDLDDSSINAAPINTKVKHLNLSLFEDDVHLLEHFPCIESLELDLNSLWTPSSIPKLNVAYLKRLIIEIFGISQTNLNEFLLLLTKASNLEELIIEDFFDIKDYDDEDISADEFFNDPETINILSQMTKMKRLKFGTELTQDTVNNLLGLSRHMQDLRVFKINVYGIDNATTTEEMFCAFVESAKNLEKLIFFLPREMHNSSFYDKFYDKLCAIWEQQKRSNYLNVSILSMDQIDPIYIQKRGKLIKMSVFYKIYNPAYLW